MARNPEDTAAVNLALEVDDDVKNHRLQTANGIDRAQKVEVDQEMAPPAAATEQTTALIFEDLPEEESLIDPVAKWASRTGAPVTAWVTKTSISIGISASTALKIFAAVAYLAFFIAALVYNFAYRKVEFQWDAGIGRLVILTAVVVGYMFYAYVLKSSYHSMMSSTETGKSLAAKVLTPISDAYDAFFSRKFASLLVNLVLVAAFVTFVLIDSQGDAKRLQSAFGIVAFVVLGAIFSAHPTRIKWRTIMWGLALQFVLGLMVLRWETGREILKAFSDQVQILLAYTDQGSGFVYGSLVDQKPFNPSAINQTSDPELFGILTKINETGAFNTVFAFKILSVIFFFSFLVSMLFHLGAMQWVIGKIGWMLQTSMATTPCESLNAAANIFVGQTEAPLLIKPFMPTMTPSEIHAVMTGGFATIAGSVLAAYISFDIPANHLLSASIMSAPAALACAKLFLPETKKTKTTQSDVSALKSDHNNILDAASQGAITAVFIVANIVASLVAVLAFVAFVNGPLKYVGNLFGFDGLTLDYIFGKVFYPLAWLMGVDNEDLEQVGQLLGVKSVINEFVAYSELRDMKSSISQRSATIATYALCGFSNPSSIGMQIAAFSTLMPQRTVDISRVAFRAYVAGSVACFLTACVAGTLIS